MHRSRGLTAALLLLAALLGSLAGARAARAGEPPPKRKRIDLTCTGEAVPAQVAPGGRGELVLRATLRDHVHVYADDTFVVVPTPREGVTYGTPVLSSSSPWTDPTAPNEPPIQVWFGSIEVRLPFTLASDASLPLKVGALLKWSACDEQNCFPPDKLTEPVAVEITAPAAPPAPTPPGIGPDATPVASPPGPRPPGETGTPPAPDGQGPLVIESKVATLSLSVVGDEVHVLFTPLGGYHLYAPGAPDTDPIRVEGSDAEGVAWESAVFPSSEAGDIREPYEVRLPFRWSPDAKAAPEFLVHWQGCSDFGVCERYDERRFAVEQTGERRRVVPASAVTPPKPPLVATSPVTPPARPEVAPSAMGAGRADAAVPPAADSGRPLAPALGAGPTIAPASSRGLLFPVDGERKAGTWIEGKWKEWGLLFLGPIFLVGLLLAFTPCVLPLIPITVSIVGGSQENPVKRGRMTVLLSSYVLGLALAFGVLGLAASFGGASLSAAFKSPVALWCISGIFVVLAFGMFGVYEMQPPAALQRLMGGAKGGSVVGSFLFGALSAVIASPCTGPVIAGMLIFAAQSGNVLLGFLMFFSLGLGMGAVFFAAGSVNLLMKPGPWMVWVRYGFGVVLVGGGLYYLASAGKLPSPWLFAAGFLIAVVAAVGIAWHLKHKEGEELPRAAGRGALVALLLVFATGAVAFLTRTPSAPTLPAGAVASAGTDLSWTPVTGREELVSEVARARREGKAVVVDVWAKWCTYCKRYDRVIEESPALRAAFGAMHRLRIHVDDDDQVALREGLDIPRDTQPFLVFLDKEGRIQRALDVDRWLEDKSEAELVARVRTLGVLR